MIQYISLKINDKKIMSLYFNTKYYENFKLNIFIVFKKYNFLIILLYILLIGV